MLSLSLNPKTIRMLPKGIAQASIPITILTNIDYQRMLDVQSAGTDHIGEFASTGKSS